MSSEAKKEAAKQEAAARKRAESNVAEQLPEATLKKIGDWVRNSSGLDAYDGAAYQRRVEFLRGDELVDCLTSDKFKRKKLVKGLPKAGWTREQATKVAHQMLEMGFFLRAGITNEDTRTDEELPNLLPWETKKYFEDDEESVYIWTLAQSNRKAILYSVLFVTIAIFIAAIKAWPIWLKIIVWWISLIMLICLLSLIVIRLVLYALFMLVGLRGIWLLPNMFNEEIDFLDTFVPIFGQGLTVKQSKEMAKEAAKKRSAKKKINLKKKKKDQKPKEGKAAKEGEKDAAKAVVQSEDKAAACTDKEPQMAGLVDTSKRGRFEDCNFGLLNVCVIFILGIFVCNYFGLFMPDNIPEFVIRKEDLFASYPSLAPPNETLATEDGEAVDGQTVEGETEAPVVTEPDEETEDEGSYRQHVQKEEDMEEEEDEELIDDE